MGKPNPEVCSIRIMFPVDSDEAAIGYKKKISAVIGDIPNAQLNFSIMTVPTSSIPPQNIPPA